MAAPYTILTRTATTLQSTMAAGANSCTLATGAFGSPSRRCIITIDGNVSAKAADFECTIVGTAVSSMTLLNGPDVEHTAGAQVTMNLVDEHYEALVDGTGLVDDAIVERHYSDGSVPKAAIKGEAWAGWTPTYGGGGSMTYGTVTTTEAKFIQVGKNVFFILDAIGTTGGSADQSITFTLPVTPKNVNHAFSAVTSDATANQTGSGLISSVSGNGTVAVRKYDASNWGLGASRRIRVSGTYEAA